MRWQSEKANSYLHIRSKFNDRLKKIIDYNREKMERKSGKQEHAF